MKNCVVCNNEIRSAKDTPEGEAICHILPWREGVVCHKCPIPEKPQEYYEFKAYKSMGDKFFSQEMVSLPYKMHDYRGMFFQGYYYDYCVTKFNKKTILCHYTERGTTNWRKGRKAHDKFIQDVKYFHSGHTIPHYKIYVPSNKNAEFPNLPKYYQEFNEEDDEYDYNYKQAVEYCEEMEISKYWIKEFKYWWK